MRKIIIANWKMNPATYAEAERLLGLALRAIKKHKNAEVIVCPPFVWLTDLSRKFYKKASFGAQDVFWQEMGVYTGEISPKMLTSSKVSHVIIGHSERRALGEEDELINKKIKAALKEGLKVILCVGEPWSVRRKGLAAAKKFVRKQLTADLGGMKPSVVGHQSLVIAYEPVWAIGTGRADKPEDTAEMARFIKKFLASRFYFLDSKVLYGGSVNSKNAGVFLAQKEIDGALVGGASLKAGEFSKIIEIANKITNPKF